MLDSVQFGSVPCYLCVQASLTSLATASDRQHICLFTFLASHLAEGQGIAGWREEGGIHRRSWRQTAPCCRHHGHGHTADDNNKTTQNVVYAWRTAWGGRFEEMLGCCGSCLVSCFSLIETQYSEPIASCSGFILKTAMG